MNAGAQILNNFQTYIVNPAILLIFSAGLLVFMFGLVTFLYRLREGTDTRQGVQHMLWGIVGMFIMVAWLGIVNIIVNFIGSDPTQPDVGRLENIKATQMQIFK